eukprot:ANDGO_03878.mRNA.1 hypothetical protein (macronuclear)
MAMNWKSEKINEISKNKIWCESIAKEEKHLRPIEHYDVDPRHVYSIAEKPNTRPARFLDKYTRVVLPEETKLRTLENMISEPNDFSEKFASTRKTPVQKLDEPLTTQQELGWELAKSGSPSKRRFYYPKTQCDVTRFAAELVKANVLSGEPKGPKKKGA